MKRVCNIIFCISAWFTVLHGTAYAQQVTINFNAAVYGQSFDGLGFVQLLNSYPQDLVGKMMITVKEVHKGNVVSITIPSFILRQGANTIDRVAFSRSRVVFGNNYFGRTLKESGRFPEGEYEYCFELDISESKLANGTPFYQNCFIQELQPMTPLLLINPIDGDEDCNKRPDFTWQPPMPLPADARFRLVVSELKDKQDVMEAVNYNVPVINQGNILVNQLNFPFNAPELKEGKKYAWQVIVYTGAIVLKRSEVWVYTVKCKEEIKEAAGESFREMKEENDGNFHATRFVRFSFNNPYNEGKLNYSVTSLTNPSVPIRDLPELKVLAGLNKYELDLSENRAFKNDDEYQLTVKLVNGKILKLRFIYRTQ